MTRTGGANPAKVINSDLGDSVAYILNRIIFRSPFSIRFSFLLLSQLKYKDFAV